MAALAMEISCLCPWDREEPVPVNYGVIAIWKHFDKVMGIGDFCCFDHFFICCIQSSVADILTESFR